MSHVLNHATITAARSEGVEYAHIVACARQEASEIAASWAGVDPCELADEASALDVLNAHLSMQGPLEPLWSDPNFRDLVARELHRAPKGAPD